MDSDNSPGPGTLCLGPIEHRGVTARIRTPGIRPPPLPLTDAANFLSAAAAAAGRPIGTNDDDDDDDGCAARQ